MKLRIGGSFIAALAIILSLAVAMAAQTSVSTASAQVPPVIQFANVATDAAGGPLTGSVEITFSLYNNSQGGSSLWSETQNVTPDSSGHYSVYLGITKPLGVPLSLFTSGEAHWLGVQIAGQAQQPRVYLVSVPYAMAAGNAQTVGGLPASAFVRANPANVASSSSGGTTLLAAPIANSAQSAKGGQPQTETENYVPIFIDETGDLGNSIMSQSGTTGITVGGNLTIGASNSFFVGADPFAFGSYANQNAFFGFAGNATTSGTGNTAVGFTALEYNTTGSDNNAIGDEALQNNTTGIHNNAIGLKALVMNKTGSYNVAIGGETLADNSAGTDNTAIGYEALSVNTASNNTAIGYEALSNNTTGAQSAATGQKALFSNTTGIENTAYGAQALYYNSTGKDNTALGFNAGPRTANLINSTAIGANAIVNASNAIALGGTGTYAVNVGIGTATPAATLDVQGSGNFNDKVTFGGTTGTATFVGDSAGDLTETIPGNLTESISGNLTETVPQALTVAVGTNEQETIAGNLTETVNGLVNETAAQQLSLSAPLMSLGSATTAQMTLTADSLLTITAPQVVITGSQTFNGPISATSFNIGSNPIAFGTYGSFNAFLGFAGNSTTTGTNDTGTGYQALQANTSGYLNTANGYQALAANTTGNSNTASGGIALTANTSGTFNTAIGYSTLASNTTASDSTAVGVYALLANNGNYNTATGFGALEVNSTGTNNTADGFEALQQNTTGINNTADGNWALINNGPGSYNTASGYWALRVNTTGGYNAAIGAYAGLTSDDSDITGNNNTFLGASTAISTGTLSNATAVGSNAEVGESNALVLGAITGVNGGTSVKVGIGTTTPGNVFTIAQNAGEAIADGWITYSSRRWKTNIQPLRGVLAKVEQLRGVSYDLKDSGKHEIGVIAEEVGSVVPEVVTYEDNGKDARGVDYSRLTALLIEATKEQQRLIHKQQQQIEKQQAELARLSSQVKAIRASLNLNVRTGSEVGKINTHVTAVRQ